MEDFSNLTLDEISSALAIPVRPLLLLAKDAKFLYRKATISKKENKFRVLEIPHDVLKYFQRELLHIILDKIQIHSSLYGGPGTSTKKAVHMHINKPMVITMDIKDFFPSIKKYHVINAFEKMGMKSRLPQILADLVTYHNHVPQGAPTSTSIGRIVLSPFAFKLDKILKEISPKTALSIYVDDITISGPRGLKRMIPTIAKMLRRYSYQINRDKTQIMCERDEQISLNIRLNKRIEATTRFLAEIEELEKQLPPWSPKLLGKKSYIRYLQKPIH